MTDDEFWGIIEQSRNGVPVGAIDDEALEQQAEQLHAVLMSHTADEIQAFDDRFGQCMGETYRWDLWDVARFVNGFVSDDGFEYFRCWLIAQGETVYRETLNAPDSLADILPQKMLSDAEFEEIWHVAGAAYREKAGIELYDAPPLPRSGEDDGMTLQEPAGQACAIDDLPMRFPKLWAKFV